MSTEAIPKAQESIATDAIRGSFFGIAASLITLVTGFARSILLARWVDPEHFGTVALGLFYVNLASRLRAFDFGRALIHRQDNSEQVLGTYFTLCAGTLLLSSAILIGAIPLLRLAYPAYPLLGSIVLVLTGAELIKGFSYIQETLLTRDLAFRDLARIDVTASLVMLVVAPWLAWHSWGVWALVAEQASGFLTRFVMSWLVFRPWRPRATWHSETARWFWNYGRPAWGAANLAYVLDRFDDFWIGTSLGQAPLGYYSRAYEFAHYPRRVIANPLVSVFSPVFARLQSDRRRLSQAFYRAAHVILRSGFLISGAFALVMPEFIALIIGDQWQPMLLTFRLMLVYTLLDAFLLLEENLLLAVGDPKGLQRAHLAQALFFIPLAVASSYLWGVDGVALAADGMLLVGACMLHPRVRRAVDFSPFKLAFWPLTALGVAYGAGLLVERSWVQPNLWLSAMAKLLLFAGLYVSVLLLVERGEYVHGIKWIWERMHRAGERDPHLGTRTDDVATSQINDTHPVILTIIIVSWNTVDLLNTCLASVLGSVGQLTCEVIVVDNGSTDGSPEAVESRYPGVHLIRNRENLGFARANNVGLAQAKGRLVLLLNSDTEVRGDTLNQMVNFMETHPDAGIVGASLRNADGTPQFSCDVFPLRPRDMVWQRVIDALLPHNTITRLRRVARWGYTAPFEADWVSGAALMIRHQVVDEVGSLDERFFMYAEEIDWCFRVKEAGWRVYHLPDAKVFHAKQGSSAGAMALRARLNRQRDRSLELFYRKHYGWPAAVGVRLIHAFHHFHPRLTDGH